MFQKKTFRTARVQQDHSLKVEEIEFPHVGDDKVLIKIEAAAINPSDVLYVEGKYMFISKPPFPAGFEGSGTVVQVGKNQTHRFKAGDRVCVAVQSSETGTWSEYVLAPGEDVFPLHADISFEEAAGHFINPATAWFMLQEVQEEGHKAIVHSVGASALGKMLIKLFKEYGIKTINLVRRDEAKDELYKIGADYVLNLKDNDFDHKFEEVVKKEHPTKLFDAIGGDFTLKMLRMLPQGSVIDVYGFLSGQSVIPVTSYDLTEGKTLKSFYLGNIYKGLSLEEKKKLSENTQKMLKTTLKSDIGKVFPLDQVAEAVEYSQKFPSKGKVLIKP
jgi:NADPH2:quinone reductase